VSKLALDRSDDGSSLFIDFSRLQTNPAVKELSLDQITVRRKDSSEPYTGQALGKWADTLLPLFPQVERLSLAGDELQSLAFVSSMPNLRELDISDNYITDVSPLTKLAHLERLSCGGNPITNLSVLPDSVRVQGGS